MRHVYTADIEGQYPVTLQQHASGLFRVQYGKQMRSNLSYAAAAREFGECLLHAATLATLSLTAREVESLTTLVDGKPFMEYDR